MKEGGVPNGVIVVREANDLENSDENKNLQQTAKQPVNAVTRKDLAEVEKTYQQMPSHERTASEKAQTTVIEVKEAESSHKYAQETAVLLEPDGSGTSKTDKKKRWSAFSRNPKPSTSKTRYFIKISFRDD